MAVSCFDLKPTAIVKRRPVTDWVLAGQWNIWDMVIVKCGF